MYMLHQADISAVAWASSANRPKEMVAVASKAEVQILGLTAHVDKPQVSIPEQTASSAWNAFPPFQVSYNVSREMGPKLLLQAGKAFGLLAIPV